MRYFITLLSLFIGLFGCAQTYFYVHTLEVIPAEPTVVDSVFVRVLGDLSSTGSYIIGHQVTVEEMQVQLQIDCQSGFGATVLVPHDTTFFIGVGLAAGDYLIDLSGQFLGDFVSDPIMYEFTVTGTNSIDEQWLQDRIDYHLSGHEVVIENKSSRQVTLQLHDLRGRALLPSTPIAAGAHRLDLPDSRGAFIISFTHGDARWAETFVPVGN